MEFCKGVGAGLRSITLVILSADSDWQLAIFMSKAEPMSRVTYVSLVSSMDAETAYCVEDVQRVFPHLGGCN